MEPLTLMWSALGILGTATFGAMGWQASRAKEENDALWKAVNELQRDTREYVTRRDLGELEERLERSLGQHEERLLMAIRLGMKGAADGV